jgi:hypothetical protein
VCSQSACMQPALGYGSTYQSFDEPVLRCWCNLQRGGKKIHTKNRMRWRGVTRQSARTGKMWWQEEMEHSITDAAWPAFEREWWRIADRISIRLKLALKPRRSIQEPK